MGSYFDTILDNDMKPVFKGLPGDTVKWLEDNPPNEDQDFTIYIGSTHQVVPAKMYLEAMERVDDAIGAARYETVHQFVTGALLEYDKVVFEGKPKRLLTIADETTKKIVKLYKETSG